MKSTYYLASSLDGFIADPSGGVDWLDEVDIDAADSSYTEFYATVDGLMMGRATYDFIFDYGSWPYEDKPSWVITSRPIEPLAGCNLQTANDIDQAWRDAESAGIEHLWIIGGGKLVRSLIQKNLLSHIQVTIMPVVLGNGIPLVDSLPEPRFLTQERTLPGRGSCEIIYRVAA